VAVGIVMLYKRSPRFAHFCARAVLKLPVIGQILHQSAIARFARTLGVTFAAGVPLVEALESVGKATGSPVYNEAVMRVRELSSDDFGPAGIRITGTGRLAPPAARQF